MYELNEEAAAQLLRAVAAAIDRGQRVMCCDVSLEGISPAAPPSVHVDVEVDGDAPLVDAAGEYFDSHAGVV